MAIRLFVQNAFTRLRDRNDFPTQMSTLASEASLRLRQLSATVERYTDQDRGLAHQVECKKALYDEMDERFEALWNKLCELQDVADQRRKR